ncbi:MAG: DUF4115 domain-containing protein [Rhodocyclaceae bacterium]|jgi:cytoskeleton protein RodZ|nr:DUF4115 domain-containing protein [Rhodocyclaceae bacterium]
MIEQTNIEPLVADAAPAEVLPLPGYLLRKAREEKGLSLSDVAHTLKFSVRQIEALESDDYNALQGATFVRGFIRAYARLLRIAPEPLLGRLDATAPQIEVEIAAPANMGEATPRPFMERHQKAAIAALIVLTALAIAAYLWTREEVATGAESVHIPPTAASEPAEPVAAPPAVVVTSTESSVRADSATVEQPVLSVAPGPGEKQLTLDFDARSWVEIKDAGNRVILTGEFPQGARQTVNGRPPFQLWIGKASGVRVVDGDKKIDLQPYARDDVARLTVD